MRVAGVVAAAMDPALAPSAFAAPHDANAKARTAPLVFVIGTPFAPVCRHWSADATLGAARAIGVHAEVLSDHRERWSADRVDPPAR
jgi:hypothetical protein